MNRPNKPESFQARKEFPDEIDRSQPYELCQYFANEQQPLARYTYIIYKEEKIKWITTFKRDHVREPTQEEKNNHVIRLTCDDYNGYVQKANDFLKKDMQTLANESIATDIERQVLKERVIKKIGEDIESIDSKITKFNDVDDHLSNIEDNITSVKKKTYDLADNLLVNVLGGVLVAIVIEFINLFRNNVDKKDVATPLIVIFVMWIIASLTVYFLRIRKYKSIQEDN